MHTKPSRNYQTDTKLLPDARIAVVPRGVLNFQKLCHTVRGVNKDRGVKDHKGEIRTNYGIFQGPVHALRK